MSGELIVEVRDKRVDPAMSQNLFAKLGHKRRKTQGWTDSNHPAPTEVREGAKYSKVWTIRLTRQR